MHMAAYIDIYIDKDICTSIERDIRSFWKLALIRTTTRGLDMGRKLSFLLVSLLANHIHVSDFFDEHDP